MFVLHTWIGALPALLAAALVVWALATARRNTGLVDIFWPVFFVLAAIVYAWSAAGGAAGVASGMADGAATGVGRIGPRAMLVLALVALWGLRLAAHIAVRNWNAPEDRRYQAIRVRNEPGFVWKSLYLVFGFQAVLAWVISAPLAAAIASPTSLGALDMVGAAVALFGAGFEAIADLELVRFKADRANAGRVMDCGLWGMSRHPNYFGEFCVAWGYYAIALGAGGWWTLFAPLIMSFLLLRVSGVALLERDIAERRPAYRDYIARTNAFFPGPRRK